MRRPFSIIFYSFRYRKNKLLSPKVQNHEFS
nr:MAG TPA_asm: hypothetical protein [Caudoviricetes sp.]